MKFKLATKRWLRRMGYEIVRTSTRASAPPRRWQLMERVDLVLDVGGNTGQFALALRAELGYTGPIRSFEPLSAAFSQLKARAVADPQWDVYNIALGDCNEQRDINIAGNSFSSSLLDMLPAHVASAPQSAYVGKEVIEVRTLDSMFGEVGAGASNIYMKIDTQGFERNVLAGAEQSLRRIETIQMELSLVPLYSGEMLFHEMCTLMRQKNYRLVFVEPGFIDAASGELMQVEGVFRRCAD